MCRLKFLLVGGYLVNLGIRRGDRYLVGMYRISGSGSGWPDIRPFLSNPVLAPVPATMVPGTGYLSRIVLSPFLCLQSVSSALQEESLLNVEHDCSLIMQKG